jgi:retron-type reverse transcriptase
MHLTDRVVCLHNELKEKTYRHGPYHAFGINDPKPRHIHKASVRDRLVHHAIYRKLYPFFERFFIHDSYSCRKDKGSHRAMNRFRQFARKVSRNDTGTAWVLKCDIRKFFANIDHKILMNILRKRIADEGTLWLLEQIINSFCVDGRKVGLPLGNLTSQLFVNVYMNEFDQFVKRKLKVRYYIRYADDFVLLHPDRKHLKEFLSQIAVFLETELQLSLHPRKITVKTVASGVDFLGWVHFPDHRVLCTATKRRLYRKFKKDLGNESIASYKGLLSHGNTYKLKCQLFDTFPL